MAYDSRLTTQYLNIICLDVPYPADYGGAMEEFYKLKALHQLGVKIILHCFVYGDRKPQQELEKYCEHVFYYERKRGLENVLSSVPFIIKTRMNNELLKNLLANDHPILFDSTHTIGFLDHPELQNRKKFVRLHNIEWIYYNTLFRSAFGLKERLFYYSEYKKLRAYDSHLRYADTLFSLSRTDHDYYLEKFPDIKNELVYVFHENEQLTAKPGKGNYLLYHGNLSVLDNYMSVTDLLNKELQYCTHPIILAGKDPDKFLVEYVKNRTNVQLIANPSNEQLDELIREAQICLAIANNPSGIKLKLINSMYRGRFIFSNESAFEGSGLENCVVNLDNYGNPVIVTRLIDEYMQKDFTQEEIEKRRAILSEKYDNLKNAGKIINSIFSDSPNP